MAHRKVGGVVSWLAGATLVISACGPAQTPPTGNEEKAIQAVKTESVPANQDNRDEAEIELTPVALGPDEKLRVVATSNIIGDMVLQVGDELVELTIIMPTGADPHSYIPTPKDAAAVAEAHVVFANGLGVEQFLDELIRNAGGEAPVITLSQGIELREFGGEQTTGEKGAEPQHALEGADPHTWTTPANGITFVHNIEHALSALDPTNAKTYNANADAYQAELTALDAWVRTQIQSIPPQNRKLVTDHTVFGYYADRYGLDQIGAVIPGFSTGAEPSAKELAGLEEAIREVGVKAIFIGTTVNPVLAQQVAEDTGIHLVKLYTGSLGPVGSGAETYVDYVRYNTEAIVEGLR